MAASGGQQAWAGNAFARAFVDFRTLAATTEAKLLLSREYLEGLAIERRRLGLEVNLLFFSNLALSLALDGLAGSPIDLNLGLVSANGIVLGPELFLVAITMIFAIFAMRYTSLFMLSMMIGNAFKMRGIQSFEFLLAHKDATFLYSEAFRLRTGDISSNLWHRIFVFSFSIMVACIFAFQLLFQLHIILGNSAALVASESNTSQIVGWFCAALVFVCIVSLSAALFLKFHFKLADGVTIVNVEQLAATSEGASPTSAI